jgi:hypothetical protein
MNMTFLLVLVSLVPVVAMVQISLSNRSQIDDSISKYCIDGGPFCGGKKTDCKALLEGVFGEHKCLKVIIS